MFNKKLKKRIRDLEGQVSYLSKMVFELENPAEYSIRDNVHVEKEDLYSISKYDGMVIGSKIDTGYFGNYHRVYEILDDKGNKRECFERDIVIHKNRKK